MKAVIDTNILVAGLGNPSGAPAKLIDRWLDGQFTLLISDPVFEEYSRILLNHPIVPQEKAETFLGGLIDLAHAITVSGNLTACKDPSDNVFLETATLGAAQYLVTKNIKHFPFKRHQNVEIVRVSKFLQRLEKMFG